MENQTANTQCHSRLDTLRHSRLDRESGILIAILINVFFLALCLIFGDLKYGAIDDYFMAAVLTGAHGTDYNPHLLFVNALYGYALIPLYKLFPTIGWYYIGEMLSVFLSLTTISYIIIKKMGNKWGTLIATLLVALLASDFYLVVQFTQCASLLSATGMLVFATAVSSTTPSRHSGGHNVSDRIRAGIALYHPYAYALFLLLWGSIMRWEAFLMGMPFFCVGLLFLIKQCWAKKIPVIITLSVMFAAAFGLHQWDRNLYTTPEYKPYMEIQGPRVTFGDGRNYNRNSVYEDLEEIGNSGTDLQLLTDWIFYDTEVFARDSMLEITKIVNQYINKLETKGIPHKLLYSLEHSVQTPLCWTWITACLLIFVTNRKKTVYTWTTAAITLSLMINLLAQNRLVYRVESGFWFYGAILAIPLWNELKFKIPRYTIPALLALIAVANSVDYFSSGDIVRDPSSGQKTNLILTDSTDYNQVFDYINANQDKMFLLSMDAYQKFSHHKQPPYKAESIGSYRNTVSLGFWTPYLPEITETLKEYGVTNPMKDVINKNVIVLDEGRLCSYLTRHYYGLNSINTKDSVVVDTLHTIGEMNFFKYRLVQK